MKRSESLDAAADIGTDLMPRYYFNFENGCRGPTDLIGRDLANDEAAKIEASKLAADLGTHDAIEGQSPTYAWIDVMDAAQRPVVRLLVGAVVREPSRRKRLRSSH